jgi:hypothetical protein
MKINSRAFVRSAGVRTSNWPSGETQMGMAVFRSYTDSQGKHVIVHIIIVLIDGRRNKTNQE